MWSTPTTVYFCENEIIIMYRLKHAHEKIMFQPLNSQDKGSPRINVPKVCFAAKRPEGYFLPAMTSRILFICGSSATMGITIRPMTQRYQYCMIKSMIAPFVPVIRDTI